MTWLVLRASRGECPLYTEEMMDDLIIEEA